MENIKKIINVWHDSDCKWVDYELEEMDEHFHFVAKPNWKKVDEVYYFNSSNNPWLRIVFKDGTTKEYNKIHGTYA